MIRFARIPKVALLAGALGLTVAASMPAQAEMKFEHVMNIGTTGTGPG